MLTTNDFLDVGRLYHVAEIFLQESVIRTDQGQSELAKISQVRSLNLYLEVGFAVENEFLEADDRIDELFDDLGIDIPEDLLFTLFDYYEQVGAYDQAIKSINMMLQITGNNPDIMAEKRAFCERMLKESDHELIAGGLTREEITGQLRELR